jgi:hypothetical protein
MCRDTRRAHDHRNEIRFHCSEVPVNPVMRTTTTVALVVAPIVMMASTIAYVVGDQGLSEGAAAGAIQIWAFIAYAVALVGLARTVEGAAPRLAATGLVLALIGCVGGAAYGMDSIQAAVLGGTIESSAATPFALRIPGLAFPLALVLLGTLLARCRVAAAPSAMLVIVGGLLFPISRIADLPAVAVASDLVLLVGFAWIAAQLTRGAVAPAPTASPEPRAGVAPA